MKILLLGANGQLGQTFLADGALADRGSLISATRDGYLLDGSKGAAVDLTSTASLAHALDVVSPDVVINAAAYNAVDRAEEEPALADRINHLAVAEIGHWAVRHDATVIHYSTDYVFDGTKRTAYTASDQTVPLSVYGRTKQAGEHALLVSGARALILRTAWVHSPFGNNFLLTMLKLARQGGPLRVVADQKGTPTATTLLVQGTLAALDTPTDTFRRIEHLVSSGVATWYDFAKLVFSSGVAAGLLDAEPALEAVESTEFVRPAARPAFSVMDNRGFSEQFKFAIPSWEAGVVDVIGQLAARSRLVC